MWTSVVLLTFVASASAFNMQSELMYIGQRSLDRSSSVGTRKTLLDCYQDCMNMKVCYGADYDSITGMCYRRSFAQECSHLDLIQDHSWVHIQMPSCTTSRNGFFSLFKKSNFAAVSARTTCTGTQTYRILHSTMLQGGRQVTIGPLQSFVECLAECDKSRGCYAFDYNKVSRTCWIFGKDDGTLTTPSNDVTHAIKQCQTVAAPSFLTPPPFKGTVPTTHGHALSTVGPMLSDANVTIPDNGCPDPLARSDFVQQLGGSKVQNIRSAEACKRFCVRNSSCQAIDFNADLRECWFHTSSNLSLIVTGSSCCTHWIKSPPCTGGSCWGSLEVQTGTLPQFSNITDINSTSNAMMMDCPNNMCMYMRETVLYLNASWTEKVTRMCEVVRRKPGCVDIIPPSTPAGVISQITSHCSCIGRKCNGLTDTTGLRSRCGYYPLDRHAFDLSGHMRNGFAYNISYSSVDTIRNSSACFSGNSFIQSDTWAYIQLGQEDPMGTGSGHYKASLSVALWVKPSGQGDMAILNNGPEGEAPISLSMTADPFVATVQNLTASIRINGVEYNTSANIPVDQWTFVAMTVGDNALQPGVYNLTLYTGSQTANVMQASIVTLPIPPSLATLDRSYRPLCIGKQLVRMGPVYQTGKFFKGCLDELHIFNSRLDLLSLQSLRDAALA